MKGRLRQGVYIMGVRMYLSFVVSSAVYAYVCFFVFDYFSVCVFSRLYLCIPAEYTYRDCLHVYMHVY